MHILQQVNTLLSMCEERIVVYPVEAGSAGFRTAVVICGLVKIQHPQAIYRQQNKVICEMMQTLLDRHLGRPHRLGEWDSYLRDWLVKSVRTKSFDTKSITDVKRIPPDPSLSCLELPPRGGSRRSRRRRRNAMVCEDSNDSNGVGQQQRVRRQDSDKQDDDDDDDDNDNNQLNLPPGCTNQSAGNRLKPRVSCDG